MKQSFGPHFALFNNNFNNIPGGMNIVPSGVPSMFRSRRQLFSYEEDEQLKKLVEEFGDKDWKFIALKMPGRTTRQCRERYKNYLSPQIINGPWTKEEDELLKEKVNEIGPHWSEISKFFKTRSDVNIKNRWTALSFHMNNDSNRLRNQIVFYPRIPIKKSKVFYQQNQQNFYYQEPNYNYQMMPGYVTYQNMDQTINYSQNSPSLIANSQPIQNAGNSEKPNNNGNAEKNEEEESNDGNFPPPPIQHTSEIESIVNDSIKAASSNSEAISSSQISKSQLIVPMTVNFLGPLPPLLQKPKSAQHFQLQQSSSQSASNDPVESKSKNQQEETRIHAAPSIRETNSNISSIRETNSNISNQTNKHSNLVKQKNVHTNLDSNFLSNFPFPQTLLSNSLASNEQRESILSSVARIDDASINTETEVLTNTFPNFGGRLW